jgi:hypothetical protein
MAETQTQNYANHAHRPTLTTIAALFTVLGLGLAVRALVQQPSGLPAAIILIALGTFVLVGISRVYTVKLQDRIIRLEMQLRLERLGRGSDLARLSIKQLTALRFASDAELPALIDRTLRENLTSAQIKEAVRDWQADWMRT